MSKIDLNRGSIEKSFISSWVFSWRGGMKTLALHFRPCGMAKLFKKTLEDGNGLFAFPLRRKIAFEGLTLLLSLLPKPNKDMLHAQLGWLVEMYHPWEPTIYFFQISNLIRMLQCSRPPRRARCWTRGLWTGRVSTAGGRWRKSRGCPGSGARTWGCRASPPSAG